MDDLSDLKEELRPLFPDEFISEIPSPKFGNFSIPEQVF